MKLFEKPLCKMTSLVVYFHMKYNRAFWQVKQLQTSCQKSYAIILTDLPNAINKLWDKISFHKHFKHRMIAILVVLVEKLTIHVSKIIANYALSGCQYTSRAGCSSWVSAKPGLNFNSLFYVLYLYSSVYFKTSKTKTTIDPDEVLKGAFPSFFKANQP